ncbi:hypothetical protein [Rhizobium sp. L1K21]|uniref:hypothetical protein n=1 Tax=Rhizobium sp. L1K21 TaxID=2954933 RepID=UPI002093AD2E|nr:hypothetical protein [Rhizobium sp. L1K21]MCO6188153.1 hypothetical protein [Rhizobium sp. L1K21]
MYASMTQDITATASRQEKAKAKAEQVEQFFLDWQDMSPAERIRAEYLASHDMTEEDLAALSEDERARIEEEIKEYVKMRLTGVVDNDNTPQSPTTALASQLARQELES